VSSFQIVSADSPSKELATALRAFASTAYPPATLEEQAVDFGALMRRPEIGIIGIQRLEHFFNGNPSHEAPILG